MAADDPTSISISFSPDPPPDTLSSSEQHQHHQQQQQQDELELLLAKKKKLRSSSSSSDSMALHPPSRSFAIASNSRFLSMGFLDILRESITLLRANSSLLISLMVLLICPVSALILSHAFLHGGLALTLSSRLNSVALAGGLLQSSFTKSVYSSLAQSFLSYTFCSPAFFTFWLLAKAAVMFTVACTYAGKKPSLALFVSVAWRLWKRLSCTYLWICLVLLGFGSMAILLLLFVVSFLDAFEFSADLVFLTEVAMALFFSVIFAHMIIIGNLANVVSILEEHYGLTALARSLFLIKGKTQVGLSLFLATMVGTAMVESLYQYRVIGIPGGTYAINTASRLWEGPLLVFMHSFLFLLDAIMSCVFYFTCKSATSNVSDKQAVWEHISIGLDLTDI